MSPVRQTKVKTCLQNVISTYKTGQDIKEMSGKKE